MQRGRETARAYFARHPACRSWAPQVLDLYVATALHASPSDDECGVALKCLPEQETITWELRTSFDVWNCLPSLDDRVRLFWVMPRIESVFGLAQKVARSLVWRRRARAENVLVDAGHLVSGFRRCAGKGCANAALDSNGKARGAGIGGGGDFGGRGWAKASDAGIGEVVMCGSDRKVAEFQLRQVPRAARGSGRWSCYARALRVGEGVGVSRLERDRVGGPAAISRFAQTQIDRHGQTCTYPSYKQQQMHLQDRAGGWNVWTVASACRSDMSV
jgi:hypothetical protein